MLAAAMSEISSVQARRSGRITLAGCGRFCAAKREAGSRVFPMSARYQSARTIGRGSRAGVSKASPKESKPR